MRDGDGVICNSSFTINKRKLANTHLRTKQSQGKTVKGIADLPFVSEVYRAVQVFCTVSLIFSEMPKAFYVVLNTRKSSSSVTTV